MSSTTVEQLNYYADGELGPDEAAEMEHRLAGSEELRAEFDAILQQKALIREAASALDRRPADLRTIALERKLAEVLGRRSSATPRLVVLPKWPMQLAAACALIAFGWWGSGQYGAPAEAGLTEYVRDAVGAHEVFATDSEYPVEFTASAVPNVLSWLADRFDVEMPQPDLAALGYDLLGVRVLTSREEPIVQYVYEGEAMDRLSVVVTRHPKDAPLHDVDVVEYPESTTAYWRESDYDYAVVGERGVIDPEMVAGTIRR